MKILITAGKSALALKMLRAFGQHEVILADYGEMPNFSSASYTFISLGVKNEDTIAHTLLNNCLDQGIDMILPLQQFEIMQMAKAQILFGEFNIEVLLPVDMALYSDQHLLQKYKDWTVFNKGKVLFSTVDSEELSSFGQEACLSGAFYFNVEHAVANLKLITI